MSEPPFQPKHFRREDERDDKLFYGAARLETHIDEPAIDAVRRLYAELLPAGGAILDLGSSWKSHLPEEQSYRRVVGLGLNEAELRQNDRLDEWVIHDFNAEPRLPFADEEFDAAVMAVSAQYLTRPVDVFRDVARIVRAGGPFIVTYSNRLFPEKAIALWWACGMEERGRVIGAYFHYAGGWEAITAQDRSPKGADTSDPLFAVWARRAAREDTA